MSLTKKSILDLIDKFKQGKCLNDDELDLLRKHVNEDGIVLGTNYLYCEIDTVCAYRSGRTDTDLRHAAVISVVDAFKDGSIEVGDDYVIGDIPIYGLAAVDTKYFDLDEAVKLVRKAYEVYKKDPCVSEKVLMKLI